MKLNANFSLKTFESIHRLEACTVDHEFGKSNLTREDVEEKPLVNTVEGKSLKLSHSLLMYVRHIMDAVMPSLHAIKLVTAHSIHHYDMKSFVPSMLHCAFRKTHFATHTYSNTAAP